MIAEPTDLSELLMSGNTARKTTAVVVQETCNTLIWEPVRLCIFRLAGSKEILT